MMKTQSDQIKALFELVSASPELAAALTGGIFELTRPENSLREDVVVNSLPVLPGSIQYGTANVNLYVPDIKVSQTSKYSAYYAADSTRLEELKDLVLPLIENGIYADKAKYYVALSSLIREPETRSHYYNFRVNFNWHQSAF